MENNIKVETWFGKEVKFVEVNGEWLAVANDVAKALGYKTPRATINNKLKDTEKMSIQIVYASLIGAAMIFSALFIIFIVVVGSILQ